MPLINHTHVPPGGYRGARYTIESLHWNPSSSMLPFDMVVAEAQAAIINNPSCNLDPSWNACAALVETAVCTRLKHDPRWCWTPESREAQRRMAETRAVASGCPTCGKQRAR